MLQKIIFALDVRAIFNRPISGRPITNRPYMLLPFLALLLLASAAVAAAPPQPGRSSLDDELLRDLKTGEGGERDRPAPSDKKEGRTGEQFRQRLSRELGAAAEAEDENPVLGIARRMRQAQQRMVKADAGQQTQGLQAQIVDELDRLIQQARKSGQQPNPGEKEQTTSSRGPIGQTPPKPSAGGGKPSSKPSTTSSKRPDGNTPAPKVDIQQMRQAMENLWKVELPQRDREQLLQLPTEEFLPKYETLIEDYFRSLSEEKQK